MRRILDEQSPLQVLLIDQGPGDPNELRRQLEEDCGFECAVDYTDSIRRALTRIDADPPDVVLLDGVANQNGVASDLAKLVDRQSDCPVVVVLHRDDPELERQTLQHGASGLLYEDATDPQNLERHFRRIFEQDRLRDELQRKNRALDRAPEGVVIANARADDWPLEYCNDAFLEMTGYDESEVLGHNCRFLQCDDTDPDTVRELREAIEDERPVETTILNERKNGERFWNKLSIAPVENTDGEVVDYIGFQRDITRRVEAERTLERYEIVVENSTDIVVLRDNEGRHQLVNQAWLDLVGHSRDEIYGTTPYDILPEEDADRIFEQEELARARGEPVTHRATYEVADGERTIQTTRIPYDEDGEAVGIITVARDVTEAQQLRERLQHQALYDDVTGLPNRSLFRERLEQTLADTEEDERALIVGLLDIDDFKAVNEGFGHPSGDELLARVGDRLESVLHDGDTVARLGGDEFSLLLPSLLGYSGIEELAGRLREAFDEPFLIDDAPIHVPLSIGFAYQPPDPTDDTSRETRLNRMTRTAERAMYRAKESPGFSWRVSTPEASSEYDTRIQIENRIRLGLRRDEFVPYYQPIYRTDDRSLYAIEILARWIHPTDGLVSPGRFIPVAEKTGLLRDITTRLVERSSRDFRREAPPADWPSPIRLNVNLSPDQLSRADVVDHLATLADEFEHDAISYVLEITEGQLVERAERIRQLSDAGFRIVVDDFGTGYSSLTRIKELPMDELKLDMEFVHGAVDNPEDRAILETVTELGHQLGVPVVGEGVETERQFALLHTAGCTAVQGYLFGRPTPLPRLLANRSTN